MHSPPSASPDAAPAAVAPETWRGRLAALPGWVIPVAALMFFAAILLPVIHAPFFGDDVTNSELTGYLHLSGDSLFDVLVNSTHSALSAGRPQLLIALVGDPPDVILGHHPMLYHAYLLGLSVVDAGLLYLLLRRFGWSRAGAVLPILLAAGLMQLRIYHDSLISYGGLLQYLLAFTLISALFFDRWLVGGRRRDLVLAIAVFALCPLIYEVSYTFVAVHAVLAFSRRRGRAAIRAVLPFLAIAAVFVVASWLLRRIASPAAVNYKVGGGPWVVVRTYFLQLFPPLPASSILFDPSIGGGVTPAELAGALWRALAVGGAIAGVSIAMLRDRGLSIPTGPAVALGLALWLAPPALLSLTPKYQMELGPGRGYLPVIVQVFGVALLFACCLRTLLRAAAARSRAAAIVTIALASFGAAFVSGVTAFNNLRVLGIQQPERAVRSLLDAGAARGAFDGIPGGSSVLFWDRDVGWSTAVPLFGVPWVELMLADRTHRHYDARVESLRAPEQPSCPRETGLVQPQCATLASDAYWAMARLRADGGTVIVAQAARAATRRGGRVVGQLSVYRATNSGGRPSPPELSGSTPAGVAWTSAGVAWRRVKGGDGWALYVGRLGPGPAPLANTLNDQRALAVIDFGAMPAPPQRVRILGASRLLP